MKTMLRKLFLYSILFAAWSVSYAQPVIFYHIPKTAGTSLATWLSYFYPASRFYYIFESQSNCPYALELVDDDLFLTQQSDRHGTKIMASYANLQSGDFGYGHILFKDGIKKYPHARNIIFLRNPLSRMRSHEKHFFLCRQFRPNEPSMCKNHLIPEGNPAHTAHNLQVYYLSNYDRDDPSISLHQHLDSAKENLEKHFDFIGITEEMETSIRALASFLNVKDYPSVPTINQIQKPNFTTEIDQESFVDTDWADIELYAFAKQLFHQKYRSLQDNTLDSAHVHYTDNIRYHFGQPLDGDGWGYREWSNEHSQPLRTSIAKEAFIRFPLQKKRYKMTFNAQPCGSHNHHFYLLVNGRKIITHITKKDSWSTYQAFIPSQCIRPNQKTTITFFVPSLFVPYDHGDPVDERSLGLSVADIHLQSF